MSLRHFQFSGSPYEQGLDHGEALKESIEKNIEVYFMRFASEAGINKLELLDRTRKYLNVLHKNIRHISIS